MSKKGPVNETSKIIHVADMRGVDIACQITELRFRERGEQVVVIKDAEKALTDLQRSTYWMWITDIHNDTGQDEEDIHLFFKGKFLTRIFIRDDDGYREMTESVKDLQQQGNKHYEILKKGIIKETSITKCSTKQMWEYMQKVKVFAETEMNARLRIPEERRFQKRFGG